MDIIDQIWDQGRPEMPSTQINVYPVEYAGTLYLFLIYHM